ncbi:cellulose synthase-like protein H2 [Cryptomeria japonica]|uniref:cellulose synthase-like protein H2 n=1 Tax=Cryptomeria japonica TaxID=3369 RepID=UPI0027DA9E37|nr:cellulose synthase-like protein H2 [Cryptomeria japonica]
MEKEMDFCKSFSLYEKIIHESKLYRAYACVHLVFLLIWWRICFQASFCRHYYHYNRPFQGACYNDCQLFYGGLKDDPFGNRHKVFLKATAKGMSGIQGPMYFGTCCFHRRKGLYGVPPATNKEDRQGKDTRHFSSSSSMKAFKSIFGESSALVASAQTIMEDTAFHKHSSPSFFVEEAFKVASCSYEAKTAWGKEVGWMHGATAEDVLTGLKVQSLGSRSIYYTPERSAFMGCAPGNDLDTLIQQKRWGTGLIETHVITPEDALCRFHFIGNMVFANLMLCNRACLQSVKWQIVLTQVGLFLSVYGRRLLEYVLNGCSAREWWNNQRMWLIVCISSWVFALFDVTMKMVGLSETVFVATPKGSGEEEQSKEGEFTFNSSALFIPPTTVLLINLAAICESTLRFAVGGYEIKNKPFASIHKRTGYKGKGWSSLECNYEIVCFGYASLDYNCDIWVLI